MNEEEKNLEPEKTGLDENRKTALLRYIAILFAVSFILVLLSMVSQMRSSRSTISELSQSSTSALENIQVLQEQNQQLQEENQQLEKALEESEAAQRNSQQAYETLLGAMESAPESREGNVSFSRAMENLKKLMPYLGENGREAYENLLEEGE